MKKILLVLLPIILFSSCTKQYIQIFETGSLNVNQSAGFWVFENDSVKLTYEFWANKGVMSFSIFNKLDKPLYIDWKNSSFIYNSNKLNYWVDEQQSTLASYYGGFYYNGPIIKPGLTINEGIQISSSISVKPERITFIPPKSFYYRSQFYLMPILYYQFNKNSVSKSIVSRNDNLNKKTTIYEQNFDYSSSPLKFRNFIAFSFTENASSFFFIDNEFYLLSVKEMDYRHCRGKVISNIGDNDIYAEPFIKKTSFYININPMNSIENRINNSFKQGPTRIGY